jgi:hypothetical protein
LRSGEVVLVAKPGYIFSDQSSGTSHSSPYDYDCHVPLIFCGTSIKAGRYDRECSPADIAPTLSAIVEINAPSMSEGSILGDAIATEYGPAMK